jgi:hypothetical protein
MERDIHTLRIDRETCELAIADLARGRTLSPDCSADKVLDTVRRAIASGGANFLRLRALPTAAGGAKAPA